MTNDSKYKCSSHETQIKVNCFRIFKSSYILPFFPKNTPHIFLKYLDRIVIADCSYLSFTELDISEFMEIGFEFGFKLTCKISKVPRVIFHSQYHTCIRQFCK